MRTTTVAATAMLALGLTGQSAFADNHEGSPSVRSVEIYTCNFNDGKGMRDFDRVVERWNRFMDEQPDTDYVAFALTPNFVNEFGFDIGWVGLAPDTASFGRTLQLWREHGGELAAEFNSVLNCSSHMNYASLTLRAPEGEVPTTPVMTFTDCKVEDDADFDQAMATIGEWLAFVDEKEVSAPSWLWFPAYGETSDIAYDFKWVRAFEDYDHWAADWEMYGNGGGWQKAETLFDGVMKCDSGRVYDLRSLRSQDAGG